VVALALPQVLDLSAAMPLRALLIVHRGADLDLDAACVERLGGLCLQVLLAAHRTWEADGMTLRLLNLSDPCRDALRLAQAEMALGVEG
jgi:chemotaxis protein CheX